MADIFISYSRKDSEHASALAVMLRSAGVSVWMDTTSLAASETWSSEIVEAIKACHTVVVLLSPDSVASTNVTKEVALASEKKKTIVPIQITKCELNSAMEYALAGLHRISLFDEVSLNKWFEKIGIQNNSQAGKIKTKDLKANFTNDLIRLAILPFEDLSPSHDNDWFADGMMDELIGTLGSLSKLIVPGRSSVMVYKKNRPKASVIGKELEVGYIVEGTVRKAGEKIRISASLTDTKTNSQLWNDKFDGNFDDIFDFQERVAREITEGLKLTLTPEDEKKIEEKITESSEAFELYQKANEFVSRQSKQDLLYGIECAQEAIKFDPFFSEVYSTLSRIYSILFIQYSPEKRYLVAGEEAIEKAFALKINSAIAYQALSEIRLANKDTEGAIHAAKKLIELRPTSSFAYFQLGFIYSQLWDQETAAKYFEKSIELDPTYLTAHFNLCNQYDRLKDFSRRMAAAERALPYFQHTIKRNPDIINRKISYIVLLVFVGRNEEAISMIEKLMAESQTDEKNLYDIAFILFKLKMYKEMIDCLIRAVEKGYHLPKDFVNDSDLDPLRNEPRFTELAKKISEQQEKKTS